MNASNKKIKKSRSRLYNPHDGSIRPATQVHSDKRRKVKYKKIEIERHDRVE